MKYSENVMLAMIKAASEISVAKINAKGARFDNYSSNFNWFSQSMREVERAVENIQRGVG